MTSARPTRQIRPVLSILALACGIMIFASVGGAGAHADPPERPKLSDNEIMRKQAPLAKMAAEIESTAQARNWAGYAGVEIDAFTDRVIVQWKGSRSSEATATIREISPISEFAKVSYTTDELQEAAQGLVTSGAAVMAQPAADLSGVEAVLDSNSGTGRVVPGASIPITVMPETSKAYSAGRLEDVSPWHAGARTRYNSVNPSLYCTLAFGLTDNSGAQYIQTAEHCGGGAGLDYKTFTNFKLIGKGVYAERGIDQLMVRATSGSSVSKYILGGPYNSTAKPEFTLTGLVSSFPKGLYLCQSGGTSGTVCGLEVVGTASYYIGGFPRQGIRVRQVGAGQAVASGDSGGPVFAGEGDGVRVKAAGVVSAFSGVSRPCQSGTDPDAENCSSEMLFGRVDSFINIGSRTYPGLRLLTV